MKVLGVGVVKNGCDQPCYGTLKLTVSEEWADGINWFFPCWYRFTKIKSWSKMFLVGIVKNGCGQSGHSEIWIEVIIWMLTMMQYFLVSLMSYFLIFKCRGSTAVVLLVSKYFILEWPILAVPRPTLGHYRGGNLTHPMLITCVLHIRPEGHRKRHNEAVYLYFLI